MNSKIMLWGYSAGFGGIVGSGTQNDHGKGACYEEEFDFSGSDAHDVY